MKYPIEQEVKGNFMAKEWIDIVDTALKIGLGSSITGIFTYLGIKLNKSSELKKHSMEHKTKLIEQASADMQHYFITWRAYITCVAGVATQLNNSEHIDLDESSISIIRSYDDNLIESWNSREKAIGVLILLNDFNTVQLLKDSASLQNQLRNTVVFDKKMPSFDFIKNHSDSVYHQVNETQVSLANFYSKHYS